MNGRESKRYAVTVDMRKAQYDAIRRAAKEAGQSAAEWMRRAAASFMARDGKAAA